MSLCASNCNEERREVFQQVAAVRGFRRGRSTVHYGARELMALGRAMWLMPSTCMKRGKNDAADAETICERVPRTAMQLDPVGAPKAAGKCDL